MDNVLVLDGLTTAQALRAVERRMDAMLAFELALVKADMLRDGVSHDRIAVLLDAHREHFADWRAQELTELRDWLMDYNRKLH